MSFCCCKFWDFASSFQTKVGVHAKKSVISIFFSVVQQCPFISSDQVVQTKNLLMLYSFQLSNNAPLSFQSKKFTPNNLLNLFSFQLFNNAPLLPEQTCVSCFSHPSTFCNFFCLLTFSSWFFSNPSWFKYVSKSYFQVWWLGGWVVVSD